MTKNSSLEATSKKICQNLELTSLGEQSSATQTCIPPDPPEKQKYGHKIIFNIIDFVCPTRANSKKMYTFCI